MKYTPQAQREEMANLLRQNSRRIIFKRYISQNVLKQCTVTP